MSRFGWHSFRHTYSTLLRANHADVKVLQFSGPRLSRCENRALPLGEVPKNGSFSTHFSLIGSLTAARIPASRSALFASAVCCISPSAATVAGSELKAS